MWNAIGRYLVRARAAKGWSQSELASLLGVARSVLCRWESGDKPFPGERLKQVANVLGVAEQTVASHWADVSYRPLWAVRREHLPPYPVLGNLSDIPDEWHAGLSPLVRDEMEQAWPRDSALELAAALRFLNAGGQLRVVRLDDLGCRLLVVEPGTQEAAGHLWRHAIVQVGKKRTLVLIPQVSIIVVSQSRERRADLLALWKGDKVELWADIELDGRFHQETANDDARRTWGLKLPRLGFTAAQVDKPTFVADVAAELWRLENR